MSQSAADPQVARQGAERFRTVHTRLRDQIGRAMVGQLDVVDGVLTALFAGGHVLLEGVPGLGKTLLVRTLGQAVDLTFSRVQFTPDMMPADIQGTMLLVEAEGGGHKLEFQEGPLVANLVLADEINRATPKTQSALLEAMQEHRVTAGGQTYALPQPFSVLATQNPIDQEGTYPLPEAQLDRFMFKLLVGYPTFEQEAEILARHHSGLDPHDVVAAGVRPVANATDLLRAREQVELVDVQPTVQQYIVAVCRATRDSPSVELGVSPRGAAALLHASKAWAWLSGRSFVTPDEVKAVAKPTLRHRLIVRPELELDGVTADGLLDSILATVPAPR